MHKKGQFYFSSRLVLFDNNGNLISNNGYNYTSNDVINFKDNNSPKNNQLKYLIIYSQILSENNI